MNITNKVDQIGEQHITSTFDPHAVSHQFRIGILSMMKYRQIRLLWSDW